MTQEKVHSAVVSEIKLKVEMPPHPAEPEQEPEQEPEVETAPTATTPSGTASSVEAAETAADADATKTRPEAEWRHDCDMGIDGTNYFGRSVHLRVLPQHVRVFAPARLPAHVSETAAPEPGQR